MNKEIMFDDNEIEKCKFHYSKYLININSIDTDKLIISNNVSFGREVFNTLLVTKFMKKLSHYVYHFQE